MRDVCPKCLHRVTPEIIPDTANGCGALQLRRCPECGEVEKMCRWRFKKPGELAENTRTPEQEESMREKTRERKRIYERSNRAKINRYSRKKYANDPKYREAMLARSRRYYWKHRDEIAARKAEYRKNNADYVYALRKRAELKRYRDQKAKEQKEQECQG